MQQSRVIPSPRSFACDLATLCAPTLAGLKPASLFRYQPAPGQDAAAMAAAWHAALSPRGVTVRVLRQCPRTGAVLVYVYRPARVARLLAAPHMLDFLAGEGYTPGTADELLDQLAERLCCEGDFPHEIGVFLGYPLADVIGFIQNRGTLPRAAIGRSTPIPPLRRQSLTAIKSASASTPAAITTAPRSGG